MALLSASGHLNILLRQLNNAETWQLKQPLTISCVAVSMTVNAKDDGQYSSIRALEPGSRIQEEAP